MNPAPDPEQKKKSYLIHNRTETAHTIFGRDKNYTEPKNINFTFPFFLNNTYL